MAITAFLEKAPTYDGIEYGVVRVKGRSGGRILYWYIPLPQLRVAIARGVRFLADHDAAGDVVPLAHH